MDGDRRDQMRVASSMGDAAGDWEKIMFDKSSEISEESRQSLKI
jgi:hypothetical protein